MDTGVLKHVSAVLLGCLVAVQALLACTQHSDTQGSTSAIQPAASGAPPSTAVANGGTGSAGSQIDMLGTAGKTQPLAAGSTSPMPVDAALPPSDSTQDADWQDAGSDDDAGSVEAQPPPIPTTEACTTCCPDGIERATPAATRELRQIAAFTPSPADVATCPGGGVFVTLDGPDTIMRVPVSGSPIEYANVRGVQPAGIACDDRGRLFVVAFSLRDGSPYSSPGVLLIERENAEPRTLPQPEGSPFLTPNGVATANGIGVYVTDTLAGVVALIRETNGKFTTQVAAQNLLGVNGIAYDGTARKLYVSNSLTQEVSSFAVAPDGTLSTATLEWSGSGLALLDGMVVDEQGHPYVAGYQEGVVWRLPEASVVAKVKNPASLAFRGGTLFIVDYHLNEPTLEGGVYAIELGVCGAH